MPVEITMPKLSDTMVEGTILRWLKKPGEYVQKGEPLFEVETDKAVMEVESFTSGILSTILVKEGEKVAVGTVIALIGGETEHVSYPPHPQPPRGNTSGVALQDQVKKETPPVSLPPIRLEETSLRVEGKQASPLARSYAQQRGIDLSRIRGTGKDGMITLKDVREQGLTLSTSPLPSLPSVPSFSLLQETSPPGEITDLPKMRKAIAATVTYSKQHIPHFYITYEITMNRVITYLEALNKKRDDKQKITINDVIIKAVAGTVKQYPALNALYLPQGLLVKKEVNLGIVIGLPDGLIIPVLKNCDRLTLEEISEGVKILREKAASGKFSATDFADGTFTISNLGMLGVSEFAAIIYPPQTAILAVSAIKELPALREGTITPVKQMKVTLSVDHRAVDGITAAKFLQSLATFLETEESDGAEKPCCVVEED